MTLAKEANVDLRHHPRGEKFLQFVADQQLAFAQTLGTEGTDLTAFEYALAEAVTFAIQAGKPLTQQRLEQIRMEGFQGCWRYARQRITKTLNDPNRYYGSLLTAKSYVRVGQTCLDRIGQLDPAAVIPLRSELQRLAEQVETALRETAPK